MRFFTVASCLALAYTAVWTADAAVIKRAPSINNSGTIPGTDIRVYDVRDENGDPLDFKEFVQGMLPIMPTADKDGNAFAPKPQMEKRDGFDSNMYVRKWCVLQGSTHPLANPYHETLLGKPNANYYTGTGKPIAFPGSGVDCQLSAAPCPITATQDITYTNAIAYTVSDSTSGSTTNSMGGAKTITNSSSVADTVAKTFETNWSHTTSHTDDYSLAKTSGTIGTTGGSTGSNDVRIDTKGGENGGGTTWNNEENQGSSDESHWNAGGEAFGFSASGGESHSKNKGTSNSTGGNTNWNTNHQDGWNNATNKEDNWSTQTQDLTTETTGTSDTTSDTNGGSESTTNSRMTTKGVDISVNKDWSNSNTTGTEHGFTNGTTITTAKATGLSRTWSVPVGKCYGLACFPKAEMMVLQYLCADTEERVAERIPVAAARFVANPNKEMICSRTALIECDDMDKDILPFTTVDKVYLEITSSGKNALRVSSVIDAKNPLVSEDGKVTAVIEPNGNFVVYRTGGNNDKVWETGATPFVAVAGITPYNHRVRINSRGHLVVETQSMFSKIKPAYQPGLFRQVWSTQPIANNYTVGTPRRWDTPLDDYVLVLSNNGILTLFDAMYIPIWCSYSTPDRPCFNTKGFTYQENYLVPTDFPTPETSLSIAKDPHNNIIHKTTFANASMIVSRDVDCAAGIVSGNGIQSPNKRFKVIVYPTGNMVFKDGSRTMWSSYTANVETTVAPYKLFLTATGDLILEDALHRWIWSGYNSKSRDTGPFKATMLDTGRFVVTDKNGLEVWDSWPHTGLYDAVVIRSTHRICYEPCGECASTTNATVEVTNTITMPPVTVTTTIATATTTTAPTPTPMPNSESILNKCKAWMDTYKIDPFVSWGGIEKDANMQAQWIYYDCACFGTYTKYKPEILRTHLGKWGTLTNSGIRKQYTDSYCDCPLAQDVYKIVPNPKNWGSLADTTQRSRWTTLGCDANVNREPFVSNALAIGGNVAPPVWTTLSNVTTNVYDRYITSFTNTTGTTIGLNITVGDNSKTTSMVITSTVTNATMAVTDSQTIAITTGYTVTVVGPSATPTRTTVTTTTKAPTPTCTIGKPGSGTAGQCCKVDDDCQESCRNGKCGTCGKDFAC